MSDQECIELLKLMQTVLDPLEIPVKYTNKSAINTAETLVIIKSIHAANTNLEEAKKIEAYTSTMLLSFQQFKEEINKKKF